MADERRNRRVSGGQVAFEDLHHELTAVEAMIEGLVARHEPEVGELLKQIKTDVTAGREKAAAVISERYDHEV